MLFKQSFFLNILHIFVLANFAIGQPLFDLLSKNTEFLIAHQSTPIDIFVLVFILCTLIPAMIVIFEYLVGKIYLGLRKYCHRFLIGIFISVIALQILNRLVQFSGIILIAGAILLGILGVFLYVRFHSIQLYITVLAPALLVFPGLFLFNSPVQKIAFPDQKLSEYVIKGVESPPIIMVIFDEFPLSALMDENRQIDSVRYPNFSELARTSYWFRNYTTIGERTTKVIPAMLSGIYPKKDRLPTATDYPNNLFTFLAGSYDMVAHEPDTMICPDSLCKNKLDGNGSIEKVRSVLSDLSVVFLHILLPSDLAIDLPPVSLTWTNFLDDTQAPGDQDTGEKQAKNRYGAYDRSDLFKTFISTISPSEKPELYFFHSRLPHIPWEYLPSGKVYKRPGLDTPGLNYKTDVWDDNEWLVIQAYQRHLLQIGFMDRLVGNLINRLKAVDLYNRALIIIAADHGVSFWPNQTRRLVYKNKPMDVMSVPFFMKTPHQTRGVTVDRNVESIDILPTIAQVLDMALPWKTDGESMLNDAKPERSKKTIYNYRFDKFVFDDTKDFYGPGLARKLAIFGSGSKTFGLYNIGSHRELIHRHIGNITMAETSDIEINFNKNYLYTAVDPDSVFIPTQIRGNIFSKTNLIAPMDLAISVNKIIYATTQSVEHEKNSAQFSCMVPASSFHKGKNNVAVFLISKNNGKFLLIPLNHRLPHTFLLKRTKKQGEVIVDGEKTIPVVSKKIKGWLDTATVKKDRIFFEGWAADVLNSRQADYVVAFINDEFLFSCEPSVERADVASYFNNFQLKKTGFFFSLPLSLIAPVKRPKIRLFAISGDVSSELVYPRKYRWD